MNYRLVYGGLTVVLVVILVGGFLLHREGEPVLLPRPVESVSPLPGDSVMRQAVIEIDMEFGYVIDLWVDGFRVPASEIAVIEGTGLHRWSPTPGGLYLTEWTQGEHRVRISWNSALGTSDFGEFEWSFRVQ